MAISILGTSLSSAHAQNKPDPKVIKDCEAVNETYDSATYFQYLKAPLSKNRDQARLEIDKKQLQMSSILVDCGELDMKTWQSMKNDYLKVIKNANSELKKIVDKYKLAPLVNLTCVKNGKLVKLQEVNPKCPKGYKELYRK